MGIGSWLMGLGIQAETLAGQVAVRTGAMPLQWPVGTGGLIWRLPTDPHRRASLFSTSQTIVVGADEVAVVLLDGRTDGFLSPGRYTLEKQRIVGSLDIVWIKTSQMPMKWGIGNVTSADGIQVGGTGQMYLRVTNAVVFNTEVVRGAVALGEIDMQRLVVPRVQGVLRTVFAQWPAVRLQAERESFRDTVVDKLGGSLAGMGLEVVDFEVVDVNLPPEFKAALSASTMTTMLGAAALVDAQNRAQARVIEAQGEATARLQLGNADVLLLNQMQASGIDPLRLKALEALNTLAANPGPGAALTGESARAQLIGQVTMAALSGAPTIAPQVAPVPAQIPAASAAGGDLAELERQLDQLTDRLARGELSEELYTKLSARIEARISATRGGREG